MGKVVVNSKLRRCLKLRKGPADEFARHLKEEKCPWCIAFIRALNREFCRHQTHLWPSGVTP